MNKFSWPVLLFSIVFLLVGLIVIQENYARTLFWDSFTDTNSTYLQDHTPETKVNTFTVYATGQVSGKVQSNTLYSTGVGGALNVTLTAGNYVYPVTITAQVSLASFTGGHTTGIWFRRRNASSTWSLYLQGQGSTANLILSSPLGSSSCAVWGISAGALYPVGIYDDGTGVKAYFDPSGTTPTTKRLELSNTVNAECKIFGLYDSGESSNVLKADNWRLEELDASPTQTLTITETYTCTPTMTPTYTPTETPTFTCTPTITPTQTSTITKTVTPTYTATSTVTLTPVVGVIQNKFGADSDWQIFGGNNYNSTFSSSNENFVITAGANTYSADYAPNHNGRGRWLYVPSMLKTIYNIYVTLESVISNYGGTYDNEGTIWGRGIILRYKDDTCYIQVYLPPLETLSAITVVGAPACDSIYNEYWGNYNQQLVTLHAGDRIRVSVSDDGQDRDISGNTLSTYTSPHVMVYVNDEMVGECSEYFRASPHRDYLRAGGWGLAGDSATYQMVYTWSGLTVEGAVTLNSKKKKRSFWNSPWYWQ